jgi:hypothetical protein
MDANSNTSTTSGVTRNTLLRDLRRKPAIEPNVENVGLLFCPGGTNDNSPAFQRWVHIPSDSSPEGTAEMRMGMEFQPSLRDLQDIQRVPGVDTPGYSHGVPPGQTPAPENYC